MLSKKEKIKELKQEYQKLKPQIETRLQEFKKIPKEQHFYEAAFCILTPQSNAKKCWQAILELKEKDFKNKIFNPVGFLQNKTRFHNNKSKYLQELKEKWKEIEQLQNKANDSRQLREWLVKNVKGLGLKEASHYLRNIGADNLAILDRHILRNLREYSIIKQIPRSLSRKKYLEIEDKFKRFSNELNIQMDHLDLLFWSMETGEVFK